MQSPELNSQFEAQEFQLPDGKIMDLYNSLHPEHQESFRSYVQDKLKRDPWAKKIIEEQIVTSGTVIQITDANRYSRKQVGLRIMEAAANDDYSEVA